MWLLMKKIENKMFMLSSLQICLHIPVDRHAEHRLFRLVADSEDVVRAGDVLDDLRRVNPHVAARGVLNFQRKRSIPVFDCHIYKGN